MVKILLTVLKETLLALIAKVAWKAIAERFFTRLVIYGLEKLASYTTNDVAIDTITDIINNLRGKRLHVVDSLGKERNA